MNTNQEGLRRRRSASSGVGFTWGRGRGGHESHAAILLPPAMGGGLCLPLPLASLWPMCSLHSAMSCLGQGSLRPQKRSLAKPLTRADLGQLDAVTPRPACVRGGTGRLNVLIRPGLAR